jgi:hypothetical protein
MNGRVMAGNIKEKEKTLLENPFFYRSISNQHIHASSHSKGVVLKWIFGYLQRRFQVLRIGDVGRDVQIVEPQSCVDVEAQGK